MSNITRRAFLHQAVSAMAGGAAMGTTAQSYARIIGANDRISLGHIGIGNRGRGLESPSTETQNRIPRGASVA
ncbi:MAG: hypothetical protein ABSF14_22170 [Terriglobia bacterium]|jgi:hypothetical protein